MLNMDDVKEYIGCNKESKYKGLLDFLRNRYPRSQAPKMDECLCDVNGKKMTFTERLIDA